MAQERTNNGELLLEARRATHAVRALARFVLLIVTYQVFVAIVIAIGLGVGLGGVGGGGEDGFIFFVVLAGLISAAGLIHALVAGHSELALSDRNVPTTANNPTPSEAEPERDERGLFPGVCSCTKWERGVGGTASIADVEYCERCNRVLPN